MSLTFNTSMFEAGLLRGLQKMENGAEKALRPVGYEIVIDANEKPPKTPKDTGDLKSSGKVSEVKVTAAEMQIEIVFDMPYAARWHEAVGNIDPVRGKKIKWSEPQSGPKYLESKMVMFHPKYMLMIANIIKGDMSGV